MLKLQFFKAKMTKTHQNITKHQSSAFGDFEIKKYDENYTNNFHCALLELFIIFFFKYWIEF